MEQRMEQRMESVREVPKELIESIFTKEATKEDAGEGMLWYSEHPNEEEEPYFIDYVNDVKYYRLFLNTRGHYYEIIVQLNNQESFQVMFAKLQELIAENMMKDAAREKNI